MTNQSDYITALPTKDQKQQSEFVTSSLVLECSCIFKLIFFFFAKSLDTPFTNYFQNRKANFNLQICIVNPILAGLYLSNIDFDFALTS